MRRLQVFCSLLAVLLLASCSRPEAESNPLLDYIPSDASALLCSDRLDVALETVFEPDHIFRELTLGKLADEPAVLSFHYSGTLVPMLAVAAGRPSETPPQAIANLVSDAESLGLQTIYIPAERRSSRKNVLLVCESETVLSSAVRHLDEQASITEVPGVSEALMQLEPKGQTLILRNDAASRFLPQDFMSRYMKRDVLMKYIKNFSDWTVLHLDQVRVAGKGQYMDFTLVPVQGSAVNRFYSVLEGLQPAQSRLGDMLPYGTTYALDLPVASLEQTLELRKIYLDATGGLNNFNRACRTSKTAEGWDPVKWAGEAGVQEVAKIWCRSEEVLLLRCANTPDLKGVVECHWKGFASVLFGPAFSLTDESCCAVSGDWIVIGAQKAVKHYLQRSVRTARKDWNIKMTKAAVLADDLLIDCRDTGIKLEVYKTY